MDITGRRHWQPAHSGPTLLVVDDEPGIRDFLRSAFEAEGFTVLAAGDGEDALLLCQHYQPDAILLDLMMPRLDGLGFLHEYRRRYGLDQTPVYLMSAVPTAMAHAKAAGVTGAFVKPFDLDDVLNTIIAATNLAHESEAARPTVARSAAASPSGAWRQSGQSGSGSRPSPTNRLSA